MKYFYILYFCCVLISCSSKVSNKSSNRLLDEFRVDEYRGYTIVSIEKRNANFRDVSMYSFEKKRYVHVKIPKWLADYWQKGDTIK